MEYGGYKMREPFVFLACFPRVRRNSNFDKCWEWLPAASKHNRILSSNQIMEKVRRDRCNWTTTDSRIKTPRGDLCNFNHSHCNFETRYRRTNTIIINWLRFFATKDIILHRFSHIITEFWLYLIIMLCYLFQDSESLLIMICVLSKQSILGFNWHETLGYCCCVPHLKRLLWVSRRKTFYIT